MADPCSCSEGARNRLEGCFYEAADLRDSNDDGQRDQRGNHRVFDRGNAVVTRQKPDQGPAQTTIGSRYPA
jgi:hypothetical protein